LIDREGIFPGRISAAAPCDLADETNCQSDRVWLLPESYMPPVSGSDQARRVLGLGNLDYGPVQFGHPAFFPFFYFPSFFSFLSLFLFVHNLYFVQI
jgi:hypothetical protein